MSPAAGLMLVNEIVPRIQAALPRSVMPVGADDIGELIQDTVCSAAQMLDAAEQSGQPLHPSGVAYYAIQRTKAGRRSYGATRTDALCPAAQLDKRVSLASMDEPVPDQPDDSLTLHDLLAGGSEDPAQRAAREIDWAELMEECDERDLAILRTILSGDRMDRLAKQFGVSAPRITQLKRELGEQILMRWGASALEDVVRAPSWVGSINATRERQACRHERVQADLAA